MLSVGGSGETILGKETTMPRILLQHLVFKGLVLIVKLLLGNFLIEKEMFAFVLSTEKYCFTLLWKKI